MTFALPTNTAYPLLFRPLLKHRVWGGDLLRLLGKPVSKGEHVGESWDLADLPLSIPDGRSVVVNGPFTGRTLHELIGNNRALIMGDGKLTGNGGFPLLIKFLDARENLSVQVHPTQQYVAAHPGCHLKSEAWVVVMAATGSVIYTGLKPDLGADDLKTLIERNQVEEALVSIPARCGDCIYLPSGTCHALGAGVLVAEIQTPSDTTFRVYDWGRIGRELHISQALECITFGAQAAAPSRPRGSLEVDGLRTTHLLGTEYFVIERVEAVRDVDFDWKSSGLPEVCMLIAGAGVIESAGSADVELAAGTTALLPAGLEVATARLRKGSWMLRVKLPSQLSGMIALE